MSLTPWRNGRNEKGVDALPTLAQKKARPLFANASKCDLDSQGRILLPQVQREHAGLTKDVTVVGNNNTAEFWDKAVWKGIQEKEKSPEYIKSVYEELGI